MSMLSDFTKVNKMSDLENNRVRKNSVFNDETTTNRPLAQTDFTIYPQKLPGGNDRDMYGPIRQVNLAQKFDGNN
jgi:hypothetical protein